MRKLSEIIVPWQQAYGRHNLPWQVNPTPYRVWVSEIMLQQTQVKTVIPYYNRFMHACPTVSNLATLPEDELMLLWQGLGYYSRARNLHKSAKIIASQSGFPSTEEDLIALPGIGRSTANAILSLAYEQPAAILDGNVKRVFCRYFGIQTEPKQSLKQLWDLALDHLSDKSPRAYTQGLMDLGANICTRSKPKCNLCPLLENCYAHQHQLTDTLPIREKKKPKKAQSLYLLIPLYNNQIGLQLRPQTGIWGKLYSPPIYDCPKQLPQTIEKLKPYRHELTHLSLHIYPFIYLSKPSELTWCDPHNIPYAIPTGIKPAIQQLKDWLQHRSFLCE